MPPVTRRRDANPVRPSLLGSASRRLPRAGMSVSGQGRYGDGDCGDRSPPRPENSWGCGRLLGNQGLRTRQERRGAQMGHRPSPSPGRISRAGSSPIIRHSVPSGSSSQSLGLLPSWCHPAGTTAPREALNAAWAAGRPEGGGGRERPGPASQPPPARRGARTHSTDPPGLPNAPAISRPLSS